MILITRVQNKLVPFIVLLIGRITKLPQSFRECGCSKCNRKKIQSKRNQTSFIVELKEIFKDNSNLDFSNTIYNGMYEECSIICSKHGIITKQANSFLLGSGCLKCDSKLHNVISTTEYINRLEGLYPNQLDYTETKYTSATSLVKISCKEHGPMVRKANYFYKSKCPKCSLQSLSSYKRWTTERFIQEMEILYPNRFTYSKTQYKGAHEDVTITCNIHKDITKKAYIALDNPCASCNPKSKLENDLREFIQSFNLECFSVKPRWLDGKELDIYIPSLKLAIEFNGSIYHHSSKSISKFLDSTYKDPKYHLDKFNRCLENNINLIHIFEFENLEEWKVKLTDYINNQKNKIICFDNLERIVKVNKQCFTFYGKSEIINI